jgi:hypothetical protein
MKISREEKAFDCFLLNLMIIVPTAVGTLEYFSKQINYLLPVVCFGISLIIGIICFLIMNTEE